MVKHGCHLYNCIELYVSYLQKNKDFTIEIERQMAPVYTLGERPTNQFLIAENIIIIRDKSIIKENLKQEYNNIYFKDFVLSDCKLVDFEKKLYILPNHVTLI